MRELTALVKRNTKLYFKDKGMFFTSLITPLILLVLYVTFLGNVYEDSFQSFLETAAVTVSDNLIDGCVGGELVSSLLAVCCVTVAFCSNFLMVQDKVTGAKRDLTMAPVERGTLALGYYFANLLSTLIVCLGAAVISLLYLSRIGWYFTGMDIVMLLLDILLLVLFGSALSGIINFFLSSQGQISAVGTIVSAGYGFICGAYMPISNFSKGLQNVLSFLPGTYGTSLLRNHCLRGVFAEMSEQGFPKQVIDDIRDSLDCNIYFMNTKVETSSMYLLLIGTIIVLLGGYILLNLLVGKNRSR